MNERISPQNTQTNKDDLMAIADVTNESATKNATALYYRQLASEIKADAKRRSKEAKQEDKERVKKQWKAVTAVAAVALGATGFLFANNLQTKSGETTVTIENPDTATQVICNAQHDLEEELGLKTGEGYLASCEGAAKGVRAETNSASTEYPIEVKVEVASDTIGQTSAATVVEKSDN